VEDDGPTYREDPVTEERRRTPLTLEYAPETVEDDPHSKPVVIIEPSMTHAGRIFVGIHPYGRRHGCHLLPEDAQRVYKHLGKLLMEDPTDFDPSQAVDWKARIEEAAARQQPKPSLKLPQIQWPRPMFRIEFKFGRVQGVIGTPHE
jgi:hypothetical protein